MESLRVVEIFGIMSKTSVNVNGFIRRTASGIGYIFGFTLSRMGIGRNILQLESLLEEI